MSAPRPRVLVMVGPARAFELDSTDVSFKEKLASVELVSYEEALATADSNPVDAALLCAHAPVDGALLDAISPKHSIKVVANYGVGIDHVTLGDCTARGITVTNTPGVLTGATADMAWALLMACARRIVQADGWTRTKFDSYQNMVFLGSDVHHATLGVIGMGRIGEEVARRGLGFSMNLLYHNRSRKPEAEKELGAVYADLDTLLAQSDYVVIVCPLTAETTNLFNTDTFKKMKNTAHLINIGRGPIVNTDDLVEALKSGEIAGAGLDVFDPEPLPLGHPLYALPNVVVTPHRGSATAGAREAMARLAVDNILAAVAGKPLLTPAN